MNICNLKYRKLVTATAVSLILAACASPPGPPDGAVAARTRLTLLQANTELASHAPIEIQDAEIAVQAAENSKEGTTLGTHLVLLANQKIEIADAWAQSRLYEDERAELSAEGEAVRLAARTREADLARSDTAVARNQTQTARNAAEQARIDAANSRTAANVARGQSAAAINEADVARTDAAVARTSADVARNQTAIARNDATIARSETELAQLDSEAARAENEELQRQILALNALATERGLVITLGDVMFETGKAELRGGIASNLDNLAAFLNRFPERTVIIEGHTDNVGTDSYNMSLSQNRADSVESYLVNRSVAGTRISSSGKGEGSPVASNETDTGRQQNRRVEVIISNAE